MSASFGSDSTRACVNREGSKGRATRGAGCSTAQGTTRVARRAARWAAGEQSATLISQQPTRNKRRKEGHAQQAAQGGAR
eukprot:11752475-Alexandrium_andersonii.AAC.1